MEQSPFLPPGYQLPASPEPEQRQPHYVPQPAMPQYEHVAHLHPQTQPYHQPQHQTQPQPQTQHQHQSQPLYHQPSHHHAHNQYAPQVASAHPSDDSGYSAARSIEYVFVTIALLATAFSLALTLVLWTNGGLTGESAAGIAAYPVAMLIISLPLFAALQWDIKRAELHDPSLRRSIYRRMSNQFVRVAAFITCLFTLVGLVYGIFAHAAASTNSGGSLGHVFGNTVILLIIAGGILVYYMRYEA